MTNHKREHARKKTLDFNTFVTFIFCFVKEGFHIFIFALDLSNYVASPGIRKRTVFLLSMVGHLGVTLTTSEDGITPTCDSGNCFQTSQMSPEEQNHPM